MSSKKAAGDRALELYEKALKALGKREYDRAQQHLTALIEAHGEERELVERARAYIAVCERALDKRPNYRPKSVEELLNYGVYLHNRGEFLEALKYLLQAAELDPKNDHALYCAAAAAARAGDTAAAIRALRSAIALAPASRAQARSDSDFDPLREEEDFVALVQSA